MLDGFIDGDDRFTIAAPHLIHFEYLGCALEDICWRERPSLESAHIDTCGPTFYWNSIVCQDTYIIEFPRFRRKGYVGKQLPTCSVFENLETLEIGDWCLTDNFNIVLRFIQLSPRFKKLTLVQRQLPKEANGARIDAMPINGMALQCPLLETVIIRCSKDDGEIHIMVNAMVANGVSMEKINVTFYEDMVEKVVGDIISLRHEQEKEFAIFEKLLEQNPEWVVDSSDARSDSDNNDDEEEIEDDKDDELEDEDDEWEDEDECESEDDDDDDDDESEDEDGEELKIGDRDDDLEDGVVDNNEHGNDNGLEGDGVNDNLDGNHGSLEDGVDNNEGGNDNDMMEDGVASRQQ